MMDDASVGADGICRWQNNALRVLRGLEHELIAIVDDCYKTREFGLARQQLDRWEQQLSTDLKAHVGKSEADAFRLTTFPFFTAISGDPYTNLDRTVRPRREFLSALILEIEKRPERVYAKHIGQDDAASGSPHIDPLRDVERVFDRFARVVRQLRDRRAERSPLRIDDEYDVQYLLRALLSLYFDDIRAEDPSPRRAGQSSRIDFVLKGTGIGIEVKMTRAGLADKELSTELISDIERYRAHADCKLLACFIYDPGEHIENPFGLITDLEREREGLDVRVYISPRRH